MDDKNEFSGFLQPGWRVAGDVVRVGVSEAERAALDALMEWREAELALEGVLNRDPYKPFFAGENNEVRRRDVAVTALRSAVDELRRARGEKGGG